MSTLDRDRVLFLAAFAHAARQRMPNGSTWASNVVGISALPEDPSGLERLCRNIHRPRYHVYYVDRIPVQFDEWANRVLTGVKAAINPNPMLTPSEMDCIEDAMRFLGPTLKHVPEDYRDSITRLARTLLQDEEFKLAA